MKEPIFKVGGLLPACGLFSFPSENQVSLVAFALVPSGNFPQSNSSGASVFPTHGRPLTPLRAERNGSRGNHCLKMFANLVSQGRQSSGPLVLWP